MLRHRRHDRLIVDLAACFAVRAEPRIRSSLKLLRSLSAHYAIDIALPDSCMG